ncbi:MAG TPA: glycosyltransferase family 4 protein [Candidatus Competibacter sp.]|nr:glycosyltransferase family 4 protein [Candidatus Competibacter sp.]
MNILFAIETSGPGGAEATLLNLAEVMTARGHRCIVAVPTAGWVSAAAENKGLAWAPYTRERNSSRHEAILGLRRLVASRGIQLIHAHLFDAAVYAAVVSAVTRVPTLSTIHGFADLKGGGYTTWAKFAVLRAWAHDVVFVSAALEKQVVQTYPIISPKARIIPNGIPVFPTNDSERKLRYQHSTAFTFGALGNIRPAKGYGVLLDAAAQVCQRYSDVRFLIAGEPDKAGLYESLLKKRTELGLDSRVDFLGHVADSLAFLQRIDCMVSSSLTEGMPLSLIEAMVQGLPIVATRCGGVPELIEHSVHGLLCEPADAEALAAMMGLVRDNPELSTRLGQAAAQRAVNQFSLEAMANRYERLYVAALGKRNGV